MLSSLRARLAVHVRDPGRAAFITWAIVAVLVAVLVRINITLPGIGHLGSALVAVLFLYAPVFVAWLRDEDLEDYGFHAAPIGRGIATAAITIAVVFPIFCAGYFAFMEIACKSDLFSHFVPKGLCGQYGGVAHIHAPKLDLEFAEFALVQLVVVALPEELFFRGFLLKLLEQKYPPARRVLGGGLGKALLLSSLAFALIHFPREADPRALATFFPGLVFGWMRSATDSILAGTITHGASNILIRLLQSALKR
ncbi:MAG TPA: CPBP family intramembrane glutamic endopeptidase [Kofleriaceae bacterium]